LRQSEISQKKKHAEIALQESEEKLRSILSSLVDMVFVFDKEGRFSFCHLPLKSDVFVSPKLFMGKRHIDVLPKYVNKLFLEAFKRNQIGRVADYEYNLSMRKKIHWFSAKMSPIFTQDEFRGSVAIVRDITEGKKAEEEMMKRNKELERFNRFAIGRELKMIELKQKIKKLELRIKRRNG